MLLVVVAYIGKGLNCSMLPFAAGAYEWSGPTALSSEDSCKTTITSCPHGTSLSALTRSLIARVVHFIAKSTCQRLVVFYVNSLTTHYGKPFHIHCTRVGLGWVAGGVRHQLASLIKSKNF